MKPSTAQQAIAKLKPSDGLTFKLVTESELEGAAVGYKAGFVDARNAAIAAIEAELAQPVEPVAFIRRDQLQKAEKQALLCEVGPEPRQDRIGIYTDPQEPAGWIKATDDLPPLDVPALAMCGVTTQEMFPMMRIDSGDGEWLWAAYQGGAIDDPRNYEADDDYWVVKWTPLPTKDAS